MYYIHKTAKVMSNYNEQVFSAPTFTMNIATLLTRLAQVYMPKIESVGRFFFQFNY